MTCVLSCHQKFFTGADFSTHEGNNLTILKIAWDNIKNYN